MELFKCAISRLYPSDFNPEAYHLIKELHLSTELSNILQDIDVNEDYFVYSIHGEPGSGCTTMLQGLCQHLCKNQAITPDKILYLALNESCSEQDFWIFMSKLAKEKSYPEELNKSLEVSEKKKKLTEFLKIHFHAICFDNAEFLGDFLDLFLMDVLKDCKVKSLLVLGNKKPTNQQSSITVKGLRESCAIALISNKLQSILMPGDISNLCTLVKCNPVAIQLVCVLKEDAKLAVESMTNNEDHKRFQNPLEMVFNWTSNALTVCSKSWLCKLCSLHRPLPIIVDIQEIKDLLQRKLLVVKQNEEGIHFPLNINVHPSIKKYLHTTECLKMENSTSFPNLLAMWLSLVSDKLQSLITDAEDNSWAFVPEKWQYIKEVGEKESYNVKELITTTNTYVSSMTEYDILQECLYHAYVQNDFKKLSAITFVIDRFLFWKGDTKITMDIVDYIQQHSPETMISPQVIIRRARFMKNEGNLRGADATLDKLLQDSKEVGKWEFKEEQDRQVVCGVCVQIKGEIQYRLGHWKQSAVLLIQSIQFFGSLPKPDKKGLSSSYGLLSLCCRNMTITDYLSLVQSHGLVQCNPLLAAYISSKEASKLAVYTPMFFLRHSCLAGEVMVEFSKLATNPYEKQLLLRIAIEDLRDSIQAHQTYKSLASREEFFMLVCAFYKLSQAFMQIPSHSEQDLGLGLKQISSKLFEHFCICTNHITVDDHVIMLVENGLKLLELKTFHTEDLPNAGQILFKYHTNRTAERLESKTCLASAGLFSNPHETFSSTPQIDIPKQTDQKEDASSRLTDTVVERDAPTVDLKGGEDATDNIDVLVDQLAATEPFLEHDQPTQHSYVTNQRERKKKNDEKHHSTLDVHSKVNDKVQSHDTNVDVNKDSYHAFSLDSLPKTVDEVALTIGKTEETSKNSGFVMQHLEEEAKHLNAANNIVDSDVNLEKKSQVRDAILWKFDYASRQWRYQQTMVYIGDPLKLNKNKLGAQRDVYSVEFIQEETHGKYVAKTYRNEKINKQYENDILSQMTARHYVALFNQCLANVSGGLKNIGEIQFLPVVHLQVLDSHGNITKVYNAEPYMSGEFNKLTDNVQWKSKEKETDLVLAYSHFTYQASQGNLLVVDIQGWVPHDNKSCTFLTDPQIHSHVFKCFGSSNWKERGYENFWKMHVECNSICKMLNLVRPPNK